MDLKDIQQKLQSLKDRIKNEGRISDASEQELKDILNQTLLSANKELTAIQDKLSATIAVRTANQTSALSDEQKKRLRLIEKTGSGSHTVH